MSYDLVMLLLVPAVVGTFIGILAGGRFSGLAMLRPKALWLLWIAVAAQIGQRVVPGLRGPMLACTFAVVLVWLAVNVRRQSRVLRVAGAAITIGVLLNGVAILTNGRMPYSARAAAAAGAPVSTTTSKGEPADQRSRLVFIADTVPVPFLHAVVSPGDVLIAIGIALTLAGAMRGVASRTERR